MAISSALGNAIVPTSYGFRNVIINGNFSINQRAYTSGSNLASGSYGFDRWKSNYTNTALTFTSAPQGQTVTISTLGVIRQIVERANVQPGSYVLSWTGTAVGRVYNEGSTAPSYSAGPLSAYLDGTANVIVEFTPPAAGSATLGQVQLELGSRATPFEHRPIGVELSLCQRYFQRLTTNASSTTAVSTGIADSVGTAFYFHYPLKVTMRATPTTSLNGSWLGYDGSVSRTVTAITSTRSSPDVASGDPSYSGGTFNAARPVVFNSAGGTIDFASEL